MVFLNVFTDNGVPLRQSRMDAAEQLQRLNMVLEVARANGNQLFIDNIEREIAALESGEVSPIVQDYLTEEERG